MTNKYQKKASRALKRKVARHISVLYGREADVLRMGINVTAKATLGRKEQGTGKLRKSRAPRSPSQALSLPHSDSQANGVLNVERGFTPWHGEGGDARVEAARTAVLHQDRKRKAFEQGFVKTG
jgi:hypothetical protein